MKIEVGATAFTKRLYWCQLRCEEADGSLFEGWEGSPVAVEIVISRGPHSCRCCGSKIAKGTHHGVQRFPRWIDHYCLGCLTPDRPARLRRPIDDPPLMEDRDSNPQARWAA